MRERARTAGGAVAGRLGLVLGLGLLAGPVAGATIHLKQGGVLEVEGWRDAGDTIEFALGGGLVRIGKDQLDRIEGGPTPGDLPLYVIPASAPPPAADRGTVARRLGDLLQEGEGLLGDRLLGPAERALRLRRLAEAWRAVVVPGELGELHGRGAEVIEALRAASDAEAQGAPEAGERARQAREALKEAQEQLQKAAGGG